MRISALIAELERIRAAEGDLVVTAIDEFRGNAPLRTVRAVDGTRVSYRPADGGRPRTHEGPIVQLSVDVGLPLYMLIDEQKARQ